MFNMDKVKLGLKTSIEKFSMCKNVFVITSKLEKQSLIHVDPFS